MLEMERTKICLWSHCLGMNVCRLLVQWSCTCSTCLQSWLLPLTLRLMTPYSSTSVPMWSTLPLMLEQSAGQYHRTACISAYIYILGTGIWRASLKRGRYPLLSEIGGLRKEDISGWISLGSVLQCCWLGEKRHMACNNNLDHWNGQTSSPQPFKSIAITTTWSLPLHESLKHSLCHAVSVWVVLTWLLMAVRMTRSRSVQYDSTTTQSCVCEPSTVTSLLSANSQSSITDMRVCSMHT